MTPLVHADNREPIRVTAERIGRSYDAAIKLCRRGQLAHQRDGAGRIWSSKDAADAFMGDVQGGSQPVDNWARRREEALR